MKNSSLIASLALPALVGTLLVTGGLARADILGGYYRVTGTMERWVDITDPTTGINAVPLYVAPMPDSAWTQNIKLPFANPFPYNGNGYTNLYIASNGFVSFTGFAYANGNLPSTTLLVPWWGGLGVCAPDASVSVATVGTEPDLTVIVQWKDLSYDHISGSSSCNGTAYGLDFFNFQLRLHEGGAIDYVYGAYIVNATGFVNCGYYGGNNEWFPGSDFPPPVCTGFFCYNSNSCLFASGLEDDTGATPAGMIGLNCGASCVHNQFPVNGTAVRMTNGPDLKITRVSVDTVAQFSPGLGLDVTVDVTNVAPNPLASPAGGTESVNLFLSTDGITYDPSKPLTTQPLPLVTALTAGNTRTLVAHLTVPATATVGQLQYVIAVLSEPGSDADVDPAGKTNKSIPQVVVAPRPDMVADGLSSPSSGTPGGTISVVPTITNGGNADAVAGIPYIYYLAPTNAPVVSPTDLEIGVSALPALPINAQLTGHQDTVTLPTWLPAGNYQVGVIVDPGGTVPELNRGNKGVLSPTVLQVTDHGLQITTTTLPYGYIGGPYQAVLTAQHGLAPYKWSVARLSTGVNSLPSGLKLNSSGEITGTPAVVSSSSVTFQVVDSASTPETQTAPVVMNVTATALPLTVVTTQLPTGAFNKVYTVELVAIGGQWPYQWSLVPGTGILPPGMSFGTDGTLSGIPAQSGAYSFQVSVTDSASPPVVVQSAHYVLQIAAPGIVTLALNQLPVAVVNQPYEGLLRASGGSEKYQWQLIGDIQLPDVPGTTSKNWNDVEPPGFNKIQLDGNITGQPSQVGLFALSVQATEVLVDGGPGSSATDTVLLRVVPTSGLFFKNSSLPIATLHVPYIVHLDTNAVSSQGSVIFQPVDGAGLDSPEARASVPPGLTIQLDGTLSGTPSSSGEYLFLVQAIDQAQNRSTISSLFLVVQDNVPNPPKTGCSTSGSAASTWAPVLLALALLRRRRK
jgi:uncharacterized protein (TIGR03382 family)